MTNFAKNEREEIAAEVFDRIPAKETLESKSDISLATLQESFSPDEAGSIIIQNEWRRREKLTQHQLNKELVKSQNKTAVIAAIFGIIGTVVGSVITYILPKLL